MMTDIAGTPVAIDPYHVWLGLDVIAENIPLALTHIDQWVLWRAQPRVGRSGTDKVPYQVSGTKAAANDPATWTDYQSALAAYQEEDAPYDGIGFQVKPDNGIILLDWDHVRNALTGEIDESALGAIRWLGTYAELSPSGTGIRVIGYGTLDHPITSPTLQGWTRGRYVTITGHHLDGTPPDLQPLDPLKLAQLVAHYQPAAVADLAPDLIGAPLDPQQVLELRHALGYLPADDYDLWVRVGMALQASGAGNQAFGIWNEWSMSSPKYEAKGMRAKWASFHSDPGGIELPTVFALATQHGWVNPASRAAHAFETAVGMSIAEANRRAPAWSAVERPSAAVRPFPVDGLQEVAAWIDQGAAISYPEITQHAVLCLVSVAASRLYTTPQGDPLSTYLGACARSIGEIRYAQHGVNQALSAAGLRRIVRSNRFSSPQAIYRSLLRSPATLYLSDDYGGISAFSKRQPSGLQEHALSLLASLYDGKTIQLDGPEDAGLRPGSGQVSDEQPVIYAPALSMLALIGTDHLGTLMRASESGRGALQQMLLAIGDERTAQVRDPQDTQPPAWLCNYLRRLRRLPPAGGLAADLSLADIFSNVTADLPPHPVVVPFAAPLEPVYASLDAICDDRKARSLLLAARGQARRIAAALAVWQQPEQPVVTPPILDWAGVYVRDRVATVIEYMDVLQTGDGRLTPYSQVQMKLTEQGSEGLSEGRIANYCWLFRGLSTKQRGELIEQMLADGVIVEVTSKPEGRGRPAKRLVAAKFAVKEAV